MGKVVLEGVSKTFGEVTAVHAVDLSVEDEEFVALVGPSGCGKSTTLRMIAGLEEVTQGLISIDGVVVNDLAPRERNIAMVFQNYALYPHMTVRENLSFGLKLVKTPAPEIEARVSEAAAVLGLQDKLNRRPSQLSGGERQRVAMGRAMVRRPQVFLFDEPLSNLDAKLRVQMRVELKRLHERLETTAIYVTHDQVEAMTLGDRVVVMKDGLVQQVGDPLGVYSKPRNRFVAGFIGSPAMNFVDCTISGNGELAVESQGLRVSVPPAQKAAMERYKGKSVILGVRPEDIREATPADSPSYRLDAVVEVVEPLGNEILLDVRAGKHPLVARVPPTSRVKIHEQIPLALNPERLHFFDTQTEQAIE